MGIVVTYLAYLAVSVSLTVFVGSALSRSGQIFLLDVFGGHPVPARAASRLMVVAFYLLNLGFVTLTMRMSGEIGSARQVIQVLSVKIGEVLLVLGGLYLANIGFLARLRVHAQARASEPAPRPGGQAETIPPQPPPPAGANPPERAADSVAADAQAAQARPAGQATQAKSRDQGLWRPRPRQALH
jgi:hypothetical protein